MNPDLFEIATNNTIKLDGVWTDWRVIQTREGTELCGHKVPWNVHTERFVLPLPRKRYSTWHPHPSSGAGGVEDLYNDVKEAIARYEKEKAPA